MRKEQGEEIEQEEVEGGRRGKKKGKGEERNRDWEGKEVGRQWRKKWKRKWERRREYKVKENMMMAYRHADKEEHNTDIRLNIKQ